MRKLFNEASKLARKIMRNNPIIINVIDPDDVGDDGIKVRVQTAFAVSEYHYYKEFINMHGGKV